MNSVGDIVNKINEFSFDNDDKKIIELLNEIFSSNEYKKHLDLVYAIISMTEMYGFIEYLDDNEKDEFFNSDNRRSISYCGKNISYYNKGQLSLLYDFDINKKVFLSAPTSFGKTYLVIEYLLLNYTIFKNVLFIVPTNSLLEELFQKLLLLNKQYNLNYVITTQPKIINKKRNLLLLTPERFLLLIESININIFDLIIMDETYKIVEAKNNRISDFVNYRSLRFRRVADIIGNSQKRVIFLSPFTYELTDSMNEFFNKFNIKKIDRKIEYVKRDIINISTQKLFNQAFDLSSSNYLASLSKNRKIIEILENLKNEKNIIYVSKYADAYELIDALQDKCFESDDSRYAMFISHLENNYNIENKNEWIIISGLKKGVGIYIAPLPRYIKKEIVDLFERNIINTLIVTTAFTEGVNTSATNLIFTSLVNGSNSNHLSDIDVLNVAGRAGRFAKSSVGKVYCISSKIYNCVIDLQNNANIKLENHNYIKSNIISNENLKIDYEIDMVDEKYLSDSEKKQKKEDEIKLEKLHLSRKDMNISLNVSLKWKLALYCFLQKHNDCIEKLYTSCKNITSNQPNLRINSLEYIFEIINSCFKECSIDGFPSKPYDIKAFDNSGKFIWGRLYKVYCAGSIKNIINKNVGFISEQFETVLKNHNFLRYSKEDVKKIFVLEGKSWILDYYSNDLSMNFDAFYTETFKFISNIVQYKIPFYVSFVVSILCLYINKNKLKDIFDISNIDIKKTIKIFEDGEGNEEYDMLIDYGLSSDIIYKLSENKIKYGDFISNNYDTSIFDNYELQTIEEFKLILK